MSDRETFSNPVNNCLGSYDDLTGYLGQPTIPIELPMSLIVSLHQPVGSD